MFKLPGMPLPSMCFILLLHLCSFSRYLPQAVSISCQNTWLLKFDWLEALLRTSRHVANVTFVRRDALCSTYVRTSTIVPSSSKIITTPRDGKDYVSDFDSKTYVQLFYSTITGSEYEDSLPKYVLDCLYEFFIKYQNEWDESTASLLEYRGGPVICYIISVVPFVEEITFAAYTEEEHKEVHAAERHGRWCT